MSLWMFRLSVLSHFILKKELNISRAIGKYLFTDCGLQYCRLLLGCDKNNSKIYKHSNCCPYASTNTNIPDIS